MEPTSPPPPPPELGAGPPASRAERLGRACLGGGVACLSGTAVLFLLVATDAPQPPEGFPMLQALSYLPSCAPFGAVAFALLGLATRTRDGRGAALCLLGTLFLLFAAMAAIASRTVR